MMDRNKSISEQLRERAMHVCDGSGYYCEAPMELLERAANKIDELELALSVLSSERQAA